MLAGPPPSGSRKPPVSGPLDLLVKKGGDKTSKQQSGVGSLPTHFTACQHLKEMSGVTVVCGSFVPCHSERRSPGRRQGLRSLCCSTLPPHPTTPLRGTATLCHQLSRQNSNQTTTPPIYEGGKTAQGCSEPGGGGVGPHPGGGGGGGRWSPTRATHCGIVQGKIPFGKHPLTKNYYYVLSIT